MTDNEIIKAFECCEGDDGNAPKCSECPFSHSEDSNCFSFVRKSVLEIINRQKSDNEALQKENKQLQSDVLLANQNYEHIKDMWEAASYASECDIAKHVESCEDCGFCKKEG